LIKVLIAASLKNRQAYLTKNNGFGSIENFPDPMGRILKIVFYNRIVKFSDNIQYSPDLIGTIFNIQFGPN